MPYNTGNPVEPNGSSDPRDLFDNSANLDRAVNGYAPIWIDRKGRNRKSLAGMELEFDQSQALRDEQFQQFLISSGYQDLGDYGPGILITARNQILRKDGEYYRISAAVEVPYTTTGVWFDEAGKFVSVGDAALRQELASPGGSEYSGFTYGGDGSATRTVGDKLRESVSVKDKGAAGDLSADDTAAFIRAGAGAEAPPGKYKVDTLALEVTNYKGRGELYALNGQVIRLDNDPVTADYRQRLLMSPVFGGAGGVPEIYPGATNAPQGLARFRHPLTGEESFFINQMVGGSSWSNTEQGRIARFAVRDDGQPGTVLEFSPVLNITHSHMSCVYENGQLWLYTSFLAPADAVDNGRETGCGWSKIPWRGAATSSAELVQYRVWGRANSGHRYEQFGKACIQVSQCGRYVIMVGNNYAGTAGGRTLFVYDRLEVESAANPLDCEPVFSSVKLEGLGNDSDTAFQGETCDGRFIYASWGSTAVFGRRGFTVYSLTGEKLREVVVDGPASLYTNAQLRNGHPTLGICVAQEPEGITLWGDKIYMTFTDNWVESSPVVSFGGFNYVRTVSGVSDTPPDETSTGWRVTDLPSSGPWVKGTLYNMGAYTRREKIIYEIAPPRGVDREEAVNGRYRYPGSVAQYPANVSNLINVSWEHGGNWRGSSHLFSSDTYRIGFEFFQNTWRVRDVRTGSDNSKWFGMRMNIDSSGHVASLRSANGVAADGAWLDLNLNTSPTNPGDARISASGTGTTRLMNDGATSMNVTSSEIILYRTTRFIDTNLYSWGTASRVGTTIYLQTAPVVSSDARLKTEVRSMSDLELAVGRRLAEEPGFYKWLCSINEKGEPDARWHAGMTVQRAIQIFEEEGLDPFEYGAICHDVWGDEFEIVPEVWLGTGEFEIFYDKAGNEIGREEIKEKWADAAERQTQWAGDKFSFREGELHSLMIKALVHDIQQNSIQQQKIMARLDALEAK